jgi:CCR4-NOT transcription complex subunit 2
MTPSQKVPGGEQGVYTFWDPENWGKERKEMTVLYADLEEKSVPVFVHGPGIVLATPQTAQAQAQQLQQQQQQQQHQHQHQQQQQHQAPGQTAQMQQVRSGNYPLGM